jgi:hypothetical protein
MHLVGHEMVDLDRNAAAAGGIDERGGFFDRFRPVHFRSLRSRRSTRAVHRRSRRPELHRDAPPGTTRSARDQRHFSV